MSDSRGARTPAEAAGDSGRCTPSKRTWRFARGAGALSTGLVALALVAAPAWSRAPDLPPGMPVVPLATLPKQAQETHRLVLSGGPFPYRKDGTTFFNRERLLPRADRGYYREYTVKTPGSPDRGARRLVCGGERPQQPDACYYTADHYASFSRIAP